MTQLYYFQVTSPKRKKKGAFISGTIDIDDLLAKEQTPTNFALDDSIASPPPNADTPKKHVEFAETISSQEVPPNEDSDSWWPQTNGHVPEIPNEIHDKIENGIEDDAEEEVI